MGERKPFYVVIGLNKLSVVHGTAPAVAVE